MDTREWFDEGTYSDLTIKLSNGTEIKVHKIIVCRENEYFRKMCGPDSRFAESKQNTIELKDDDPAALTSVLRHIYKLPIEVDPLSKVKWRIWFNIRTTADKYLEPELSETADKNFRSAALASTNPDKIFDIIETINSELPHDESLVELADKLRKDHLVKLLKNDRFRAQLDNGGKESLWQILDELIFAADLKEKRHHLCSTHEKRVFQEPSADKNLRAHCEFCRAQCTGGYNYSQLNERSGRQVWALK